MKNNLWLFIFFSFQVSTAYAVMPNPDITADTQNCPIKESLKLRRITFRVENDSFAKTDRNYSHGMAITAESSDINNEHTECLPFALRLHSKIIKFLTPDFWVTGKSTNSSHNVVVKFGQSIFTPGNSLSRDLILNDRPYAGLLYAGMSTHQRYYISEINLEALDSREITIGIIGPLSFAKEFQDLAHDLLGDERFLGWEHQLDNEPALQIAMEKKFKDRRSNKAIIPDFSFDFIPSLGMRLGNIETSANLGIEGRIGWNLPNDFGSFTIHPGEETRPSDTLEATSNSAGFHFFTILEIKLVGYNFALDGNLSRASHHVTRRPWVGYGTIGLSFPTLLKKRSYKLTIMDVYHTGEFAEQESRHAYRAVGLSVEF